MDIPGQSRFTVDESGYGSGDKMGNSVFAEATSSQVEKFTQIHRASCEPLFALLDAGSIPDGTFAERLEASALPRSIIQDRFPGAAPVLSSGFYLSLRKRKAFGAIQPAGSEVI